MKVIEKINEATEKGRVVFSFEFFPPKTGHGTTNLLGKMNSMVVHDPCFCAMSMDSSGSSADLTIYNANEMHNQLSVETMMHITCINMLVDKIDRALDSIKSNGIQNVLALGDPPRSQVQGGFLCGIDLVEHIRAKYGDYFGVTVVGYPEAHFDVIRSNGEGTLEGCENDLMYLKRKVDAGADLIIAPLFYDTDIFLKFVDDCRRIGITCPVIPGIMPINNYNDFMHITKLSKIKLPSEIAAAIEPIKDNEKAVRNYGIHLGTEICKKILAHGIKALHFYTLNFEKPTMAILQNLGLIDKAKIRPLPHRCVRDVQPNSQAKRKRHISARFKSKRPSYGTSTGCQLSTSTQSDTQAIPGIMEDSSALELPPSQPMNREVLTELPASRLPWLMLADDPNSAATHTFFSLVDSKIYEIELPEVKGKRCVGSSEGWLITIDSNLEIGLLNPFSRVQIQLPPQPTFEYQYHVGFRSTMEYRRDWYIHKAFVSNPLTDDCVALAIHYLRRNLAFCRPGSTAWTTIASMDMNPFEDAIFYQGRFYAISQRVKLVVCDLGSVPRAIEVVSGPRHLLCWIKYLVNASDTLLMVARKRRVIDGKYATLEFEVYILVPDSGRGVKWKLVKNLRSLALFIGGNSTICLSVDEYPECKRNCIYFTDDYCDAYRIHKDGKGSDMGVYNYGDGTFEPVYPGVSRSRLWPPVWVKPN